MHISQLKGFRDIKRMARNNNMHLDKLVSRILTEALFNQDQLLHVVIKLSTLMRDIIK